MTLEDLLRKKVSGKDKDGDVVYFPPEFRVSVQSVNTEGVHIIIHADGHNSDTLDFRVKGNTLSPV